MKLKGPINTDRTVDKEWMDNAYRNVEKQQQWMLIVGLCLPPFFI